MTDTVYHLPTKPYNLVECFNRIAAATGSVSYARAASSADYNGHAISLGYNDYRGYYVGEYYWGERVVIVRSENFAHALKVVKEFYNKQGKGASLVVRCLEKDAPIADADPDLVKGLESVENQEWYTWRHEEAGYALRTHTDHLLLRARDKEHYDRLQGYVTGKNGGKTFDPKVAKQEWELVKDQPIIR